MTPKVIRIKALTSDLGRMGRQEVCGRLQPPPRAVATKEPQATLAEVGCKAASGRFIA